MNSYPTVECDYQTHAPQSVTLHNSALQKQHKFV